MKGVVCIASLLSVMMFSWPSASQAAVTKIPFADMVLGSEVTNTSLATNGTFSAHSGFDVRYPENWNSMNGAAVTAAPVNVPTGVTQFGGYAFQVRSELLGGNGHTGYQKSSTGYWPVSLQPNTEYVISAYMWNIGDASNHMRLVVDLGDAANEVEMVLNWDDPDAADGYFVYGTFHTGTLGNNALQPNLRVFADGRTGLADAGALAAFPVVGQIDNVRVTPLADFAAPTLVPEPASLALLGFGGLGLLRRRKV